jgi:hypothetical protein
MDYQYVIDVLKSSYRALFLVRHSNHLLITSLTFLNCSSLAHVLGSTRYVVPINRFSRDIWRNTVLT